MIVAAALIAVCLTTSPPDIRTFRPSSHGFKFRNAFKGSPLPVSLGAIDDAIGVPDHYGLCGGMSAAAADFFMAGRSVPADADVPGKGTDLYNYIFRRQVDSLRPGFTQATVFARWMRLPDDGPDGTRARSWPIIASLKAEIGNGRPVMLGLVLTSREAKGKLWENHQVMAYSIDEDPAVTPAPAPGHTAASSRRARWRILIYDPNFPGADDARLEVSLVYEGAVTVPAGLTGPPILLPTVGLSVTRRAAGRRDTHVRGVFVMPYEASLPSESLR
ncbi:MAG: hypothetical protein AB7G11_02020 [Phycisphaerales bacterium]